MQHASALPQGTELVGDYRIERVLGAGGFGITYLAQEIALGRAVTIKEYFPTDFAARRPDGDAGPRSQQCAGDYKWGLDRFIAEAQTLARFDHPNIVKVFRYFRANNTGYMVLSFEEGQSLKAWMKSLKRAPRQKEIDRLLKPLLEALEYVHAADYLHRDLAPDNIMIRPDGAPVLIDFGSARGEIAHQTRTLSALVKPGYSPYEQYAETGFRQGPWTDIYALGATLYHICCGKRPPDSPSRVVRDDLKPAQDAALSAYRQGFLAAIDNSLALETTRRPQTIAAWKGDLLAPDPKQAGWLRRVFTRPADAKPEPAQGAMSEAGGSPPLPDAPGRRGGLVDYIENLKKHETPAQPVLGALAGSDAVRQPPADAQTSGASKTAPAPRNAPKTSKRAVPAPRGRRWRPAAYKLATAAATAGLFLLVRDSLPQFGAIDAGLELISGAKRDPAMLVEIAGHRGGADMIAFMDDGKSLATAGGDGTLRMWNTSSGALQRTITLDAGPATALSAYDRRLLTGHASGAVSLWDAERGERIGNVKIGTSRVVSLAFAGSNGRFAASDATPAFGLWESQSSAGPLHTFEGHDGPVNAVAYADRGPYLASAGADRSVKLWNADGRTLVRTYRGHKEAVTALAFSGDGRQIAAASGDGIIKVWSSASNRLVRSFDAAASVTALAFAPNADVLAVADSAGAIRLYDLKRGRFVRTLAAVSAVKAIAYTSDGLRLATVSRDGRARVFDVGGKPRG
jgi:serine/threonine protein kinase